MKFSSRWLVLLTSHVSLLTSFSIAPLLLVTPAVVFAQWEPDRRLTFNDSASFTSPNNAHCIATGLGGMVHVVWCDNRDGYGEIYYKSSVDSGGTWDTVDTRLSNSPRGSRNPSISSFGSNVHVVWEDCRSGLWEIYYKRSTDSGVTWSPEVRLAYGDASSMSPCIVSSGANVQLVWSDSRAHPTYTPRIYYKRSTDSGVSWSPDSCLSSNPTLAVAYSPSVVVSGADVHVVWFDDRDAYPNFEIYYKRSTDSGGSWSPDIRLTNDPNTSQYPSISSFGSNVHVVWEDTRAGKWEIYYKKSTDGGISWSADTCLIGGLASSWYPMVYAYPFQGIQVHVVWEDTRNRNEEIYCKYSPGWRTPWSGDVQLTSDQNGSVFPSIAVTDSFVNVVWSDNRDGNWEIYYKRERPIVFGVEERPVVEPQRFGVGLKAIPNPFTSFTTIPGRSSDRFALYDISGRRMGTYRGDRVGEGLATGVYFLRPEGKDAKPLRIIKLR